MTQSGLFRRGGTGREIRLITEEDGWWTAVDETFGVANQGRIWPEALENLDEAVDVTGDAREDETPAPKPDAPSSDV